MLVNTLTNTAGGVVQIPDINQSLPALLETPGPVIPDGTYVYTDVVTDLAGNASQPSPASPVITIDTAILVAPPPTLTPSSDSGLPVALRDSDDITNIAVSTFQGTVGPNAVVALFVGVGTLKAAGTTTANAAGNYAITTKVPLVQGLNNVDDRRDRPGGERHPAVDTPVGPPRHGDAAGDHADPGRVQRHRHVQQRQPHRHHHSNVHGNATPWQFLERQPDAAEQWDTGPDLPSACHSAPPPPPTGPDAAAGESRLPGGRGAGRSGQRRRTRDGRPVRQPAARGRRRRDGHGDSWHRRGQRHGGRVQIPTAAALAIRCDPPTVTLIGGGGSNTGFIPATAVAMVSGGRGHRDQIDSSRLGLSHAADGPDRLSESAVTGPGHL